MMFLENNYIAPLQTNLDNDTAYVMNEKSVVPRTCWSNFKKYGGNGEHMNATVSTDDEST